LVRRAFPRRTQTGLGSGRTGRVRRKSRLIKLSLMTIGGVLVALLIFYRSDGLAPGTTLQGGAPSHLRAAIIDQLGQTEPNPSFVESATSILTQAAYNVDYYQGEDVTVDLYRELPGRHYDLVILRVHSGLVNEIDRGTGTETLTDAVALATGELYDEAKYVSALGPRYPGLGAYRSTPRLFGITPDFVRFAMQGEFDKTTIVLMGCDGLWSSEAAQAFLDRGARAFVSWSGQVSAAHTDAATERLLHHLVGEGLGVRQAVTQTMAELGPDPRYGGTLLVYPSAG